MIDLIITPENYVYTGDKKREMIEISIDELVRIENISFNFFNEETKRKYNELIRKRVVNPEGDDYSFHDGSEKIIIKTQFPITFSHFLPQFNIISPKDKLVIEEDFCLQYNEMFFCKLRCYEGPYYTLYDDDYKFLTFSCNHLLYKSDKRISQVEKYSVTLNEEYRNPEKILEEEVCYVASQYLNYYGYVIDFLTRIVVGLHLFPDNIFVIPLDEDINLLKKLGVKKIHQPTGITTLYKNCNFISIPCRNDQYIRRNHNLPSIEILRMRQALLDKFSGKSTFTRVYILGSVRFKNQRHFVQYLRSQNFIIISHDVHSLEERIAILSNAEIIISDSGYQMTDIIFCKRNCKIIELTTSNILDKTYFYLSKYINSAYFFFKINEFLQMEEFINFFEKNI